MPKHSNPFKQFLFFLFVWTFLSARPGALKPFEFHFVYQVFFPPGNKIEAWIPLPSSGPFQEIEDISIQTRQSYAVEIDSVYGNTILHLYPFSTVRPETLSLRIRVHRQEATPYAQAADSTVLSLFTRSYRKVPLTTTFRSIADSLFRLNDHSGKRVYNYILNHMEYDKSGTGWGQGDAQYACDIGRGNCTDYHSFFNALIRSEKVPARFNIGFSIPPGKEGPIAGYHCWTEYYESGKWFPVDISEADKHPELVNYYFGHLDNRRVTFTIGRDIPLPGGEPGDQVNFFVSPYVKLNGQVREVETRFSFQTIP